MKRALRTESHHYQAFNTFFFAVTRCLRKYLFCLPVWGVSVQFADSTALGLSQSRMSWWQECVKEWGVGRQEEVLSLLRLPSKPHLTSLVHFNGFALLTCQWVAGARKGGMWPVLKSGRRRMQGRGCLQGQWGYLAGASWCLQDLKRKTKNHLSIASPPGPQASIHEPLIMFYTGDKIQAPSEAQEWAVCSRLQRKMKRNHAPSHPRAWVPFRLPLNLTDGNSRTYGPVRSRAGITLQGLKYFTAST